MTMPISDKGGRELAVAWLRRAGADAQRAQTSPARPHKAVDDARRPVAKTETGAVFHSDTHVGFSRV